MFSNEALAQRRNHFKIVFYVLVFFLSNHTSPLTRVLFLSPSNTFPLPCNTYMLFATNTCRHSTLPSLSLLSWLPPPTYSARSPLWHAKTGAHLQQNKFHTMLKYECPLKCTWALPLVLTSSNRWHVYGNIKSSNPSSFHRLPTVHGLSVCMFFTYPSPCSISLCSSVEKQTISRGVSLFKVGELCCAFVALRKKKKKNKYTWLHRMMLEWFDSFDLVECYPVVIRKFKVQVELH